MKKIKINFEPFEVKRYLVYGRSAAYYIADTDFVSFCVRVTVPEKKKMFFFAALFLTGASKDA